MYIDSGTVANLSLKAIGMPHLRIQTEVRLVALGLNLNIVIMHVLSSKKMLQKSTGVEQLISSIALRWRNLKKCIYF